MPPVYPVSEESEPLRRRAIFSSQYQAIPSHHAQSPDEVAQAKPKHKPDNDSLRLIDDLINRPVDQLYSDARLVNRPNSRVVVWATRIVVFIICIAVGFAGSQFVRLLNTDPRKQIRESLSNELIDNNEHVNQLDSQISELRKNIEAQSKTLETSQAERIVQENDAAAGATAVEGEGIVLTIANPLAANSDNGGSLPRESTTDKLRVVTDTDLQLFVSLLWQNGAEAIAINDNRLGVETSIRTAGNSILIGTTPVQSPYRIQAIGDRNELAQKMSSQALPTLYSDFSKSGMHPQISKTNSMRLPAATVGQVTYAKGSE